jgi:ribulose-phosphate 3-epimerase
MIKIAPSILTWDFTRLGKTLKLVENAGVDMIHLDIMDGHFVPNISFGPALVKSINDKTSLPLDVHLMIEKPENFVQRFKDAGADIITVHAETVKDMDGMIKMIKKAGLKAGLSLNPRTGIEKIEKYLSKIDMVLLMTVHPGFGGQQFISAVLAKIKKLKKLITLNGLKVDIEVDGGINSETAVMAVRAGANILVAGSYLYSSKNIKSTVQSIRRRCIDIL